MKNFVILTVVLIFITTKSASSQNNLGINNENPSPKSALDIKGSFNPITPQGILIPRYPGNINASFGLIGVDNVGLMYYDTLAQLYRFYQGGGIWSTFGGANGGITGLGSTGTVPFWNSTNNLSFGTLRTNGTVYSLGIAPNNNFLFQIEHASNFPAFYVRNNGTGEGIWGLSSNTAGTGVRGSSTGAGIGVYGTNPGTGRGVFGENTSTGVGVYATNTNTVVGGTALYASASFPSNNAAVFPSGRVGIGTETPTHTLQVDGTSGTPNVRLNSLSGLGNRIVYALPDGRLKDTSFAAISSAWSLTGNTAINANLNFIGTTDARSFRIRTNNIERIFVDSLTGSVGIGTKKPGWIAGAGKTLTISLGDGDIPPNGISSLELKSRAANNNQSFGRIDFVQEFFGTTFNSARIDVLSGASVTTHGQMVFSVSNGTLTERMRIAQNGNVGIGTPVPNVTLDVNGGFGTREQTATFLAGNNNALSVANMSYITNTTDLVTINGIIAGSDGQHLIIHNRSSQPMFINNESLLATAANRLRTGTGGQISVPVNATIHLIYNTGTSRWLVVSAPQQAGIGGLGVANKVAFWSDASTLSSNNNFHWDNANGRLGIGLAIPTSPLHVNLATTLVGRAITVDYSNNSTTLGVKAGLYINHIDNTTTATSHGVYVTSNNASGTTGAAIAVGAYASGLGEKRGLDISASGGGTNIGIFANASGGTNNYSAIFASGLVGIGTVTPASSLHINSGTSSQNTILDASSTIGTWLTFRNTSTGGTIFSVINTGSTNGEGVGKLVFTRNSALGTTSGAIMTLQHSNSNVGIGTTNPDFKLDIQSAGSGNAGSQLRIRQLGIGGVTSTLGFARILLENASSTNQWLISSHADAVLADNVFNIFNTTNGDVFKMFGTGNLTISGGTATKAAGTTWAVASDSRIKKDITDYHDGLDKLLKINPVYYKFKESLGYKDTSSHIGVIAQEIEKVLPYTVQKIKTQHFEDQRIFDASALTFLIINSIKEQQSMIDSLQKKTEAQEDLLKKTILEHDKTKSDLNLIKQHLFGSDEAKLD